MKSRLHKIEIRNFKAFREFTLNLEGRHLLVYGDNGAGKSSFYWALYTFLQSARKPKNAIAKYFDPAGQENLLNIHEQASTTPKLGEIALTLRDVAANTDTTFRISQADHDTHQQPVILKGDLASDFITYRFFFGFSDFRNSEKFNVWPLFEEEILPFCVSTGGKFPLEAWLRIKQQQPNPNGKSGRSGKAAYRNFHQNTKSFADMLPAIVDSISTEAQKFYDKHFSTGDPAKLTLKLGVTTPPSSSGGHQSSFQFTKPVIEFGVIIGDKVVNRPQAFLNEAKLTQLALSVRFAAALVNLHDSDLKFLVLDDLLVSLDMSNRMKVVEILLTDPALSGYQKLILTHDIGFYQEFRRYIGTDHASWGFYKFAGNGKEGCRLINVKTDLEIAQDYLERDLLEECGNRLRKYAEYNLEVFLDSAANKLGLHPLFDKSEFSSLAQRLGEAQGLLAFSAHKEFAKLLQGEFTKEQLEELVAPHEIDPAKFSALPDKEKGRIIAKLLSARSNLQRTIIDLLSEASRKRLTAVSLLEEVEKIKDRILNPASHAGKSPLFKKEAEDAIKVISALEATLNAALATI